MKKDILIMFGGVSAEHEVSIITGLQVFESIDCVHYTPHALYVDKKGVIAYLPDLTSRKDFFTAKRLSIAIESTPKGVVIKPSSIFARTISPYAVYLAFHGGSGESGPLQGFWETYNLPYTSVTSEAAVITMNKGLTKQVVAAAGVPIVPGCVVRQADIQADSQAVVRFILDEFGRNEHTPLPLIIKPSHLGSSIGIKVAHTAIELEKALIEGAHMDTEILVERYLTGITEYNCAVRLIDGRLETSEIERPLSSHEILSFTDKYAGGAKKTGGSGMASLKRELPAKITPELATRIHDAAKKAFTATRCKGMVRIDFMHTTTDDQLYLTEINPIPGSMAYYLWEASGISFRQQITDLIEQSVRDHSTKVSLKLEYQSDIVKKFVTQ